MPYSFVCFQPKAQLVLRRWHLLLVWIDVIKETILISDLDLRISVQVLIYNTYIKVFS